MIKLSIIIPTYNKIELVEDCIQSIIKYNDIGDELEIIISDNSQSYELYEYFEKHYNFIKLIKNNNIGFGGACNRGFEISNGKYLLFLNPDTILVEPVFKFAIEKFEANMDLSLFGVQLIDANYREVFSFGLMDINTVLKSLKNKKRVRKNKFVDKNMFISGADLFIRRESFVQAGCFDENIFMYCEELDLVRRIKKYSTAKKIEYYKAKKIIHLGGATEQCIGVDGAIRQAERYEDSLSYYAKKYELNYKKILRYRLLTTKLKRAVYVLRRDKANTSVCNALLNFYKKRLKDASKEE